MKKIAIIVIFLLTIVFNFKAYAFEEGEEKLFKWIIEKCLDKSCDFKIKNTNIRIKTKIELLEWKEVYMKVKFTGKWDSFVIKSRRFKGGGASVNKKCYLNLENNTTDCDKIDWISVINLEDKKAVFKFDFEKLNIKKIKFISEFYEIEWSGTNIEGFKRSDGQARYLNIWDSISNDGWAGDWWDQSNDSEIQLANNSFNVYESDYWNSQMLRQDKNLFDFCKEIICKPTIELTISNNTISYKKPWFEKNISSANIFALNWQKDDEWNVNYDIYAWFNSTIWNSSRDSKWLKYVSIVLE